MRYESIRTIFDEGKDPVDNLFHTHLLQRALKRVLPKELACFSEDLSFSIDSPLIKSLFWEGSALALSFYFLTPHRPNAAQFFYEMISRWLLPGRHLNISSFFAIDFKFSKEAAQLYTAAEIVIALESKMQLESVYANLPVLETEIKLGLASVHHARRILEIKGLSSDEKSSLIQERIALLLKKRPQDFDYDLFNQMQHFFVMCTEEFKAARSYVHMSRIIYIFYTFEKMIKKGLEKHPQERAVFVKLSKLQLQMPFGLKRVLALFVGVSFLNDNELFEARHLLKVLEMHFPKITPIEHSYFVSVCRDGKAQMLYLEVEKEEGVEFRAEEISDLRKRLPGEVKNGVEKLMRPLFMPRNEEEIMRNIVILTQQLKYPKDMPQVIISFDQQTEDALFFTIILVRILHSTSLPLQEVFDKVSTPLKFTLDRVKKIGMIRKKYEKEASVFYLSISALNFLRSDHSIDLLKARQEVFNELQKVMGEVRDYNGGMIAQQHEQFLALKALFPPMQRREELLLENLFHAIYPVEIRSVIDPLQIKIFFNLLTAFIDEKREGYMSQNSRDSVYFVFSYKDPDIKQRMDATLLSLYPSQLVTIAFPFSGSLYFGYIYQESDAEKQKQFLRSCCSKNSSTPSYTDPKK